MKILKKILIGFVVNLIAFFALWICNYFKINDDWFLLYSALPFLIIMRSGVGGVIEWFAIQLVFTLMIITIPKSKRMVMIAAAIWIVVNVSIIAYISLIE